jgi:hypothetical protein
MPQANTVKKAKLIQELVARYYEPGRQDRCLLWVYRNVVVKQYPMCERTYFRYLKIQTESVTPAEEDKNQLKLF